MTEPVTISPETVSDDQRTTARFIRVVEAVIAAAWLFAFHATFAVAGAAVAVWWAMKRHYGTSLFCMMTVVGNVAGAVATYPPVFGECAGAPAWVPYHDGMTLCPGQGTSITIEIPLPLPGRDL